MEYRAELKEELNRSKLVLRVPGMYCEDYQVRMLRENIVSGIVVMNARGEGTETIYEYDVTGLLSLKKYYEKKKITGDDMRTFLKQIQRAVENAERYLLNPNRLILDPDYIFVGEETTRFCYYPKGESDIRKEFHRLMDYFVQWTDYQDIPSVKTAFLLHKETMKENYSLEGIGRELEKLHKEEQKKENQEEEKHSPEKQAVLWEEANQIGEYDAREHEWISNQKQGSRILKETDNLWTPVKRLLQKHKRPKWGEWDGIYVDEEDF